jgi:hypothetical protein
MEATEQRYGVGGGVGVPNVISHGHEGDPFNS